MSSLPTCLPVTKSCVQEVTIGGLHAGAVALIAAMDAAGKTFTDDEQAAINTFYVLKDSAPWGPKIVSMVSFGCESYAAAQIDWIDPAIVHSGPRNLNSGTPTWNSGYFQPDGNTVIDAANGRTVWSNAKGGYFFASSNAGGNHTYPGMSWSPRAWHNSDGRLYAYMHNTTIGQGALRTLASERNGVLLMTLHLGCTSLGRAIYRGVAGGGSRVTSSANQTEYGAQSNHDSYVFAARTNDSGTSTHNRIANGEWSFQGHYDPSIGGEPADAAAADLEGIGLVEAIRDLAVALGHVALP